MFRYALIIVGALALGVYILVLAGRGSISGRFRTISLVLLVLFLLLAGAGLYTTQTQYSVQSVQEEYASRQEEILDQVAELYSTQSYTRARELAERYRQVNDPRIESWYRRTREAELLERVKELPDTAYADRLEVFRELFDLTSKDEYALRMQDVRSRWQQFQESLLTDRISDLPDQAIAQKALGYRLLMQLNPGRVLYKQQHRAYVQKVEAKIQATPWSDRCSSREMDPCRHIGYQVVSIMDELAVADASTSEICGVSWRPKGTLIDREGRTAPENGAYYLVHDWKKDLIVLVNTAYVRVRHPFPEISAPRPAM